MAKPRSKASSAGKNGHGRPSPDVAEFVATLAHPHKAELLAVREIILAANANIQEGIKWNAPSFWCGEWFATFHLRAKAGLLLVLHRGAKTKLRPDGTFVDDPEGLLSWLSPDRCTVSFADAEDVRKKSAAFRAIIRTWSRQVTLESKSTGGSP